MELQRTPEVIDLEIPARSEVVSVARLVIGAIVAADPAFDDDRAADVRLAISEACTNAIQAQISSNHLTTPVTMRCSSHEGTVTVEVIDHAGGFDPESLEPHPEVTDPARLDHERGLGIPLLRMLSDEVSFNRTADGTSVVMHFMARPGSTEPR